MSTRPSAVTSIDIVREDALANIERLFHSWGLQYVRISPDEFDFLNPSRIDKNFGAVRFNSKKGLGADFADVAFTESDYTALGPGLDRSDFGFSKKGTFRYGFDIIGLCQRVNKCDNYRSAAKLLRKQLTELDREKKIIVADLDASIKRKTQSVDDAKRKIDYAFTLLNFTKDYVGTLGELYLNNRCITPITHESTIRFHPRVMCKEANASLPTIVFKIQDAPNGEIKGIHRIYLTPDGSAKAEISNPKMALGDAKHNAIWFGEPGDTLYIAEGPENALTLRIAGAKFVACAIFAGNMSMLNIPSYVKHIVLCPDRDNAGITAVQKSRAAYKDKFKITTRYPKKILKKNGKYADLNDILTGNI